MRDNLIKFIIKISNKSNAFDLLEEFIREIDKDMLKENLIECGIMPEMFSHDSSNEKLWAKYSDIILSHALNYLNINSKVLAARGNSADVYGETEEYSLVADAKTFRLSRTAKNQKDFKVNALDSWRQNNNFSLLVSPLIQYPSRKSQIYRQAIEKNVTLLSYTHLYFLLEHHNDQNLKPLFEIGNELNESLNDNEKEKASNYWNNIDKTVCDILNRDEKDLDYFKQLEIEKTVEIGNEGIRYWENKINEIRNLSKEEAIELLIKSEKIETKINTIRKSLTRIGDNE